LKSRKDNFTVFVGSISRISMFALFVVFLLTENLKPYVWLAEFTINLSVAKVLKFKLRYVSLLGPKILPERNGLIVVFGPKFAIFGSGCISWAIFVMEL
jgi:hypothetical protein